MSTPLQPPDICVPGQPYYLFYNFRDYETGALTDPASLTLDITYGSEVGYVSDTAGPFTYAGASADAANTLYRLGEGQYAFDWSVPAQGVVPGVYTANWTAIYGPDNDNFLALENFPVLEAAPFIPVPPGDVGFWTGSITYQPSWAPAQFTIPLGAVDGNGTTWILQSVTGWDGAPSVGQVIQRSADHGGWPAAQFYGPRIVTLKVMASASSQALRDLAKEALVQAVAVGTSATDLSTFVYGEPVPKQAQCRLNGSASITATYPSLVDAVFTVPLVCPDPRKYSTSQQSAQIIIPAPPDNPLTLPFTGPVTFPGGIPESASSISVTNQGTFETRPQLVLQGPVNNPSIVNTTLAQAITFTGLLMGSTDVLTIDTDNRQCFLNNSFYPADQDSAWWVLQPGTSTIYLAGQSTGGAVLTLTWRSAWM